MPKERVNVNIKARLYEREFNDEFRVNPNNELHCILCNTTVNCEKRFRVNQHRESAKHKRASEHKSANQKKQSFLPTAKTHFKLKLVEAFLSADIPLHKLQNQKIKDLFTDLGQPIESHQSRPVDLVWSPSPLRNLAV